MGRGMGAVGVGVSEGLLGFNIQAIGRLDGSDDLYFATLRF